MVRALVHLDSITPHEGYPTKTLKFSARYDDTIPEHKRFQKATPSGHIELNVDNPDAIVHFEPGKHYYVDFSPVDDD